MLVPNNFSLLLSFIYVVLPKMTWKFYFWTPHFRGGGVKKVAEWDQPPKNDEIKI